MDQSIISRLYQHMNTISIENSPVLIVIIEEQEDAIDISVLRDDDTEIYAYRFKNALIDLIDSDPDISQTYVGVGKYKDIKKCLRDDNTFAKKPLVWICPSSRL
jgi:hypothetical protein